MLPIYLRDIEDLTNLAFTCRYLHTLLEDTSPNTILHLAHAAGRIFFRPAPLFLLAACAPELGAWAAANPANAAALRAASREGNDGVMALALQHCGLTLARIRELYELKHTVVNPGVDLVDYCIGEQWYAQPDFWTTVEDACTINVDPCETFFHLAIYGGLFGAALVRFIESGGDATCLPESAQPATRLEWAKYCIPDAQTYRGQILGSDDVELVPPLRRADAVGPYAAYALPEGDPAWGKGAPEGDAKGGVLHMFGCSPRWRALWQERVWARVGGTVEWEARWEERSRGNWASEYKPDLWEAVCWYGQGLEGFEMLRGKDGKGMEGEAFERGKERLVKWKKMIEEMEGEPTSIQVGKRKTGLWPDLKGDMRILTTGIWPGR